MTPKEVAHAEQMIRLRNRFARSYREGHKHILVEAELLKHLLLVHDDAEALRAMQGQPADVIPFRARSTERPTHER